jgi:hypothetical protein
MRATAHKLIARMHRNESPRCAFSTDGNKWKNIRIQSPGGPSIVNQDDIIIGLHNWLGDYEALASDSLNQSAGFIGGYTDTSAGYQNIRENKF